MTELIFTSLKRETVARYIEEVLCHINFKNDGEVKDDIWQYNIRLSLWEIFANIIQYENTDEFQPVIITINDQLDSLTIHIDSNGQGFSWINHSGKECPPFIQDGGRGLYILEQITDEFSFDEHGTKATLRFLREGK